MKNLAKIRDEHEGAFTLVELLVVILIIGILAAIAIPAFLNQRKAAVDSSVESDVKNASTQIETWAVSNSNADIPQFSVSADENGVISTDDGDDATVDLPAELEDLANTITVGDGTTLEFSSISDGDTGDYTITGTNDDGNRAVAGIEFISSQGGLQ